jgi:hypothetical protein
MISGWRLSANVGGVVRGGAVHLRVELLRTSDGRLEGVVITESGRQQRFSSTLDLLRILEELDPPADPSLGQMPQRRPR